MSQLATVERPVQHAAPPPAEVRRILTAAWVVLERSRFRSLKVRQVLTASDTSASNFYRHFRSKSHLLLALLADETARADARLSARLAELESADDQLREWLAFTIRAVADRRRTERARLFLDQDLLEELPAEVRAQHDVLGNRLVQIIRRGNAQGRFRSADPVVDCGDDPAPAAGAARQRPDGPARRLRGGVARVRARLRPARTGRRTRFRARGSCRNLV